LAEENVGGYVGIDQRLLRLVSEPVRLKALLVLGERSAGVSELAEELGIGVSDAARQLEQMEEAGLVEVVGEVLGPNAIEPCYRAIVRVLWDDEEWAELGLAERRRLSAWIMQLINVDICEALETGTFDLRLDAHISRTVSMVDEQGWHELSRIHAEALKSIIAVETASADRLAESGEESVRALSAMICGELPPRSAAGS
jgi:DNA-binding transcriptional ArsR family regulator